MSGATEAVGMETLLLKGRERLIGDVENKTLVI
jgi:hypothetical protein